MNSEMIKRIALMSFGIVCTCLWFVNSGKDQPALSESGSPFNSPEQLDLVEPERRQLYAEPVALSTHLNSRATAQSRPPAALFEHSADHAVLKSTFNRVLHNFKDFSSGQEIPLEQNLVLLQIFSQQLAEQLTLEQFVAIESDIVQLNAEWREATRRMLEMYKAEDALYQSWGEQVLEKVDVFKQESLARQKEVLGPELYELLVGSEPDYVVNDDGFYGELPNTNNAEARSVSETEQWLAQWRQSEIDEQALRTKLSEHMVPTQVAQLVDMNLSERDWLTRLDSFADEYLYVEQAGLQGEDEKLVRRELMERHFDSQERFVVERLLFNHDGHRSNVTADVRMGGRDSLGSDHRMSSARERSQRML